MSKSENKGIFTEEFWKSFDSLGIYSTEADGLLADQMDSSVAGGANSSDADENSSESKEQNNDSSNLNLDNNINDDSLDLGGNDSFTDNGAGPDESSDGSGDLGNDSSSTGGDDYSKDPEKNPFKSKNGKSLLDAKLAELQAAVTDTLQKIYVNPKVDAVVVSELENLQDSVRNIRETVFMIPVENTEYKYDLATATYALLSKEVIKNLRESND